MGAPAENGQVRLAEALDGLGRDAEHVLRYRAEIERRLSASGVGSIGELVDTARRLRGALAAVDATELTWTRTRIDDLIARVEACAAELATLRQLKRRVPD